MIKHKINKLLIIKSKMSTQKYNYLFKIITIGENFSDKVKFIEKFTGDELTSLDFSIFPFIVKTIDFGNKTIKLQIWNLEGEYRFRTITKTHYKGAKGIIIMYDITNQDSFKTITRWTKILN